MTEPQRGERRVKTLVLGLDGATMKLLAPLMDRGLLPNLHRVLANGVYAPLTSTIPPFTGPAWVSIVTGVNPGQHGIYGFGAMDAETGELSLTRAEHIGVPRLWQLVNAQGLSTGVVNVPLIYPPDPVDGFMVTGMLTPSGTRRFAYPPSLADLVQEAVGGQYHVDVSVRPEHAHDTAIVAELTDLLRQRERALHALLDHHTPGFLMAVLVIPDRLQHLYWGYMIPSGPEDPVYHDPAAPRFRAEIEALYAEVDAVVGRLLERVGPRCRTFIVSDHGFGRYERLVNLNNWLRAQGWLTLGAGGGAMQFLKRCLLGTPGARRLVRGLRRSSVGRSARRSQIDWARTRAYTGTNFQQGVYVNLRGRQPHGCVEPGAAYESLRREIAAGLAELRDPRTGEPLFERVYLREEVYHGPYVHRAPEIRPVVRGNDGYLVPGFGNGDVVEYQGHLSHGCHDPEGVFVAYGPGIRQGVRLPAVNVVDVTPTVLYGLDLAVPSGLDGRVLADVFESAQVATHPIRDDERTAAQMVGTLETPPEQPEEEDQEVIVEHLRGLGYL